MAIYSAVPPPPGLGAPANAATQQPQAQAANTAATAAPIDIEAWTVSALQSLSLSPNAAGTTGLSIPLDEPLGHGGRAPAKVTVHDPRAMADGISPPRRPPSRRDSMKRRDAALKGKEGSRQRRRWENGKCLPFLLPNSPLALHVVELGHMRWLTRASLSLSSPVRVAKRVRLSQIA